MKEKVVINNSLWHMTIRNVQPGDFFSTGSNVYTVVARTHNDLVFLMRMQSERVELYNIKIIPKSDVGVGFASFSDWSVDALRVMS